MTSSYRHSVRRLVLWDIDGTLVRLGGLGAEVFESALRRVLGRVPGPRPSMGGKTDPQIVVEYLELAGERPLPDLVRVVLSELERSLAEARHRVVAEGRVLPGVRETLAALDHEGSVTQSVLTGNLAGNAAVKVSSFGLDRWLDLEVGAYGSDERDRCLLVPVARERVERKLGWRPSAAATWVVGDTLRDLACARAGGARCVLVATGSVPFSDLAASDAEAVLHDLSDTEAVVKLLAS